jgi:hypothetical protein
MMKERSTKGKWGVKPYFYKRVTLHFPPEGYPVDA